MATKKTINVSNMMDDFQDNKTFDTAKQKKLDAQKDAGQGGGVPDPKGKGSDWRRRERPCQKTIHFDKDLDKKLNIYKQVSSKTIEDIIYDIVDEWFAKNYEEEVKKKLLGSL